MKAVKKTVGKIKTVFGGGAEAAEGASGVAGLASRAAAKLQDMGSEGTEALRAARRRPFAKLTARSGRLSTALGMANTLG